MAKVKICFTQDPEGIGSSRRVKEFDKANVDFEGSWVVITELVTIPPNHDNPRAVVKNKDTAYPAGIVLSVEILE